MVGKPAPVPPQVFTSGVGSQHSTSVYGQHKMEAFADTFFLLM